MPEADPERLDERLRAVERAVTDGDRPPADLADAAEATDRIDDLDDRVEDLERRLADLAAATRALRGYVGNVRSVNREVERRAETAVSVARRAEARLDGRDDPTAGTGPVEADHDAAPEPRPTEADHEPSGEPRPTETDQHATQTGEPDEWPTPWSGAGETPNADGSEPPTRGPAESDPGASAADPRNTGRANPEEPPITGEERESDCRRGSTADAGSRGDPRSDTETGDRDPATGTAATPASESTRPRPDRETNDEDRNAWNDAAWPGGDDRRPAEARSDGGSWPPDGMDVDRAQPWSVPDPGDEDWDHEDERKGLLARVRESL